MGAAGKRVVVTGASRGLGAAIARGLAADGARLVLVARDREALERVGAEVKAERCVVADVAVEAERVRLVQELEATGPIDVLVNNAGIEITIAALDQTAQDVDRQIAVNLVAPIRLAQLVLPAMVARGSGVVVTVSSMSGKSPTPYNSVYAATKHGVNGFTASVRIELQGTGVHAGVVCPSFVADAGMWSDTGVKAPAMLREVPLQAVVDGVRRVIDGAPEVLVTPGPIRPLLAIAQVFPALDGWVLRRMGVLDTLKERARVALERRGR